MYTHTHHLYVCVYIFVCIYSGPPLMWPPLGNGKSGRIRGVAAGEGEIQISDKMPGFRFYVKIVSHALCIHTDKSEISPNLL